MFVSAPNLKAFNINSQTVWSGLREKNGENDLYIITIKANPDVERLFFHKRLEIFLLFPKNNYYII